MESDWIFHRSKLNMFDYNEKHRIHNDDKLLAIIKFSWMHTCTTNTHLKVQVSVFMRNINTFDHHSHSFFFWFHFIWLIQNKPTYPNGFIVFFPISDLIIFVGRYLNFAPHWLPNLSMCIKKKQHSPEWNVHQKHHTHHSTKIKTAKKRDSKWLIFISHSKYHKKFTGE